MKKTLLEILMKYLLTDLAHKTLTVLMKYHINHTVIIVHQ